jgi:glycosyltransferase involved in cell wall biosynthesis
MSDETEKSVLIITYYWPPSGGSGVQRWLKFVKYLPTFGYTPYVFTPENPAFEIKDESLLKDVPAEAEVLHFPIWEPYELFNKLSFGKVKAEAAQAVKADGLFKKLAKWVRGNFFIPDPRVFWVKPSVSFLSDFIKEKKIRHIITTGPPHSVHLIGLKLKKQNPSITWLADFRDPWSEWDLLDTFYLTRWARKRHQVLERQVLQLADRTISISPYHVDRLKKLGGRRVSLLTNGFDESDFASITHIKTDVFTIRHLGTVDELRNPIPFLHALTLWIKAQQQPVKVKVEFIGNVHPFVNAYIEENHLQDFVVVKSPVSHQEVLHLYAETNLLLLVLAHTAIAAGNLPGKFFEYLASGTPMLAIGPPDGDLANILKQENRGEVLAPDDVEAIKNAIDSQYQNWQQNKELVPPAQSPFTRRNLTKQLVELLEWR